MTMEFDKRVDTWNKRYKPKKEDQMEESSDQENKNVEQNGEDIALLTLQQTFSDQVYEWNQRYRVRRKSTDKSNTGSRRSSLVQTDSTTATHDLTQININERVNEWNQHYRPSGHALHTQTPENRLTQKNHTVDDEHINLTSRVNLWESYYHPSKKCCPQTLQLDKRRPSCASSVTDNKLDDLVSHWNKHYSCAKHRLTDVQLSNQRRSKLNRVTSLLVQRWDNHYTAGNSNLTLSQPETTPTNPKVDSADADATGTQSEEKKKLARGKVSRTPSLVRARIEGYATNKGAISQHKLRSKGYHQEPIIIGKNLCKNNIAELKSKFSLTPYDPKSIQLKI